MDHARCQGHACHAIALLRRSVATHRGRQPSSPYVHAASLWQGPLSSRASRGLFILIPQGSSHKCVHDSAPGGRPRRGKSQLTSCEVGCRSVEGRLRGPCSWGGAARRQPVPPQGAEALALTGRRTMKTRGTRPRLSPSCYRWAEPSLTVQPLGTGRPLAFPPSTVGRTFREPAVPPQIQTVFSSHVNH